MLSNCKRLLRVPRTARRSNQSILKEINPEYSLEGLMLKLRHFSTPWTAACLVPALHYLLASAHSSPLSQSSPLMTSSHLVLCRPFSSHTQSFPASGSFPMSQLFASGGQSIRASVSATVLPMNTQGWFPVGLTSLSSLLSKTLALKSLLQYHSSNALVLWHSAFFMDQFPYWYMKVKVAQSCPTFCDPMDCSPWYFLGQNTGVDSCSLLKEIFPTQGLNPGLPHCRQILYQLSHKGSPKILEWVAYPFSRGSSQPRNQTRVSCIAGGFFTNWTIKEAQRESTKP